MDEIGAYKQRVLLRQIMKEKRNTLSDTAVNALSCQVIKGLRRLEPIKRANSIMSYCSIKNEVNLDLFNHEEWMAGRRILLPRVAGPDIEAVEFTGHNQLHRGPLGIREPQGNPVPPESIDVVLVPGLCFDPQGYRLGYGKGYYDRFLRSLSARTFICGVCYDFQVVPDVYPHEKDEKVHWIVTDASEVVIDWEYF
ncbi:MAG: 5-formyltetrahydrofolate cyclo-ligase [Syntrophomonadaceae bacterium]|jgi:5-formyltetrahydrofolate cyclo-ligase